jgi:cytochrome P450
MANDTPMDAEFGDAEVSRAVAIPRFARRTIPAWREWLGLPRFYRNYAQDGLDRQREFGDVVERRLGAPSVHLCHPDLARHVLRTNVRNYVKGPDYKLLRPVFGDGIFVSEGERWTSQRRLLAPEFRPREVVRFLPLIEQELGRLERTWQPSIARGDAIDVGASLLRFTLLVVGGALFQTDFSYAAPVLARANETLLRHATLRMVGGGLPAWLPLPGAQASARAEQLVNEVVFELISTGHGSLSGGSCPVSRTGVDLISRMSAARDRETGEGMSEQQLIDEAKSLIFAGHETTGLALSWTMYLLAQHPEIRARVVDEVAAVCAGREVRLEHLDKLVFVRQVLLESMRLYPPVPAVTRTALADDAFEGIVIRAGESVTIQCYALHRHPDFWAAPERFDPERFAPARAEGIDPFAYLPFLSGRRACLGEHFAMLEATVALATLLTRFEFELLTRVIRIRPITTLRMDRPLLMRIRRRSG